MSQHRFSFDRICNANISWNCRVMKKELCCSSDATIVGIVLLSLGETLFASRNKETFLVSACWNPPPCRRGRKWLYLFDSHSRGAISYSMWITSLRSIIFALDGDSHPPGQPEAIILDVARAGLMQEIQKNLGEGKALHISYMCIYMLVCVFHVLPLARRQGQCCF